MCRLGMPNHKPNPRLWFYNVGLGSTNEVNAKKWLLKTFPTLLRENNHTDVCIFILLLNQTRRQNSCKADLITKITNKSKCRPHERM